MSNGFYRPEIGILAGELGGSKWRERGHEKMAGTRTGGTSTREKYGGRKKAGGKWREQNSARTMAGEKRREENGGNKIAREILRERETNRDQELHALIGFNRN